MKRMGFITVILAVLTTSCGGYVVVDSSSDGKGGEIDGGEISSTSSSDGGSGGSTETTSSTSSTSETTSSTTDTVSTITSTTTKTCDNPKTTICFEACCDEPVNPTMCVGNEAGYCCPDFMYCIPKS